MLFEDRIDGSNGVMETLIAQVLLELAQRCLLDRTRPISTLPLEALPAVTMIPSAARSALQLFDEIAQGCIRAIAQEHVNVIVEVSDTKEFAARAMGQASHQCVKPCIHGSFKNCGPIQRREHDMHQQQHIAMRVIHALYIDITGTQLRSIPRSRLQPAYRAVGAPSFSWGETFFAHAKSVKTPLAAATTPPQATRTSNPWSRWILAAALSDIAIVTARCA